MRAYLVDIPEIKPPLKYYMPKMQNISREDGVSKEFGTAFSFLFQYRKQSWLEDHALYVELKAHDFQKRVFFLWIALCCE